MVQWRCSTSKPKTLLNKGSSYWKEKKKPTQFNKSRKQNGSRMKELTLKSFSKYQAWLNWLISSVTISKSLMPGSRRAGRRPGTPDQVCVFRRCASGKDLNQSLSEGPQCSADESLQWLSHSRDKVMPLLRNASISGNSIDHDLGWNLFGSLSPRPSR